MTSVYHTLTSTRWLLIRSCVSFGDATSEKPVAVPPFHSATVKKEGVSLQPLYLPLSLPLLVACVAQKCLAHTHDKAE